MDVRKLVKVYNVVNDERRNRFNLKFVAVLAAFLLAGAALVGLFLAEREAADASDAGAQAGTKSDYVGLSTQEIASGQLGGPAVADRLAKWRAEHPYAVVEKQEEVRVSGVVVGYRITYREP